MYEDFTPTARLYPWQEWEKVPSDLQTELLQRGGAARAALLDYPGLDSEHQLTIARGGDLAEKEALLDNEGLHPEALDILIKTVPVGTLAWYSRRMRMEAHHQKVLYDLGDNFAAELAYREDLTLEIQQLILDNGDEEALEALAANPVTSHAIQKVLAKSSNLDILGSLSCNPNLHSDIARKIAPHGIAYASAIAAATRDAEILDMLVDDINSAHTDIQASAAANPHLTAAQQVRLARSTHHGNSVWNPLSNRKDLCLEAQEALLQKQGIGHPTIGAILINADVVHPGVYRHLEEVGRLDRYLARSKHATVEDIERLYASGKHDEDLTARKDLPKHIEEGLVDRVSGYALGYLAQLSTDTNILRKILDRGEEPAVGFARENEHLVWTDDDLVPSAHLHYPYLLDEVRSRPGVNAETWDGLVQNWQGSIKDLLEACTLV